MTTLTDENCYTMPDGSCAGNGCIHDFRPAPPRDAFTIACGMCRKVWTQPDKPHNYCPGCGQKVERRETTNS